MFRMERGKMRDRVTFIAFTASCQFLGFSLLRAAAYEAAQVKRGERIHCVEPKIQWATCFREHIANLRKAQKEQSK